MGRGVDDSRVRKFSMKEAAGTGGRREEPRWTAARVRLDRLILKKFDYKIKNLPSSPNRQLCPPGPLQASLHSWALLLPESSIWRASAQIATALFWRCQSRSQLAYRKEAFELIRQKCTHQMSMWLGEHSVTLHDFWKERAGQLQPHVQIQHRLISVPTILSRRSTQTPQNCTYQPWSQYTITFSGIILQICKGLCHFNYKDRGYSKVSIITLRYCFEESCKCLKNNPMICNMSKSSDSTYNWY